MAAPITDILKTKGIEFTHEAKVTSGFHGTSKQDAHSIVSAGFNFSFGNPDSWLGQGVYFFDNANFAGSKYALCFARHSKQIDDPAVVEAGLHFKALLDINEGKNNEHFWKLYRLLKSKDTNDDVDEKFVAFYIGTEIAKNMNSDGIGWVFPLSEPPGKRSPKHKKQRGYAVKKLAVINRVNHYRLK